MMKHHYRISLRVYTSEENDKQYRNIFMYMCIGNELEVRCFGLWQFITLLLNMKEILIDNRGVLPEIFGDFKISRCSKQCLEQSHRSPES